MDYYHYYYYCKSKPDAYLFLMFGFALFIVYFSGDGSVRYPETSSYRNIFLLLTIKTGRGGLVDITFHFSRV